MKKENILYLFSKNADFINEAPVKKILLDKDSCDVALWKRDAKYYVTNL